MKPPPSTHVPTFADTEDLYRETITQGVMFNKFYDAEVTLSLNGAGNEKVQQIE